MKHILTIASVLCLCACQSTGVVPVGQGEYMIGKKDSSPGMGISLTNKAEVYKEAGVFCQSQNKSVETIDVKVQPAFPGFLGSTELVFKCVK